MTRFAVTILCILFLTAVSSCKKEKFIPDPGYTSYPSMDATVDGRHWISSSLNASVNTDTASGKKEFIINGWKKITDETIYIVVNDFAGTGAYNVGRFFFPDPNFRNGFYDVNHSDKQPIKSGTVYITNVDTIQNIYQGKYDFVTVKGTKIEGKFTVSPHYSLEK